MPGMKNVPIPARMPQAPTRASHHRDDGCCRQGEDSVQYGIRPPEQREREKRDAGRNERQDSKGDCRDAAQQ